jgi:hypothetical protein
METADGWRKSSHSGANGGECVEVRAQADAVMVRDSKNPAGHVLMIPADAWSVFASTVK